MGGSDHVGSAQKEGLCVCPFTYTVAHVHEGAGRMPSLSSLPFLPPARRRGIWYVATVAHHSI